MDIINKISAIPEKEVREHIEAGIIALRKKYERDGRHEVLLGFITKSDSELLQIKAPTSGQMVQNGVAKSFRLNPEAFNERYGTPDFAKALEIIKNALNSTWNHQEYALVAHGAKPGDDPLDFIHRRAIKNARLPFSLIKLK